MLDYCCQVYHKLSGYRMISLFMIKHSTPLNSASSSRWRCFAAESSVAGFQISRIWINNLTIFCVAIFVLFTLHSNNLGDNDLIQLLSLCWQEQRSVIIFYLVAFCTFESAWSVLHLTSTLQGLSPSFFFLFPPWKRHYLPYMLFLHLELSLVTSKVSSGSGNTIFFFWCNN